MLPTTTARTRLPVRRATRPAAPPADHALVEQHLGLVRGLACRALRTAPRGVELDDLISLGTVALLEAARRYDPSVGASFSTFAFPRVRGAIVDGIAQLCMIKRSTYRRARREVAAGRAGVEVDSLEDLRERGNDLPADAEDVGDALDRARLHRAVARAVARLPERHRRFVEQHYGEGRDLMSIGADLGVSKSWASRLHARTVAELRRAVEPLALGA